MNPQKFLALERGKQFSRCVVPQFLAKFSTKRSFCLFPTSLHILIAQFNEVRAIIAAWNGKAGKNYIYCLTCLTCNMHCGLFFIHFFSFTTEWRSRVRGQIRNVRSAMNSFSGRSNPARVASGVPVWCPGAVNLDPVCAGRVRSLPVWRMV